VFRREYTRQRFGEYGRHVVWAFTKGTMTASGDQACTSFFGQREPKWAGFWDALNTLLDHGLLIEVSHLVESSAHDCEILHPCAWDDSGEPVEQAIADAAKAAGLRMLGNETAGRAIFQSNTLVPVSAALGDVQLVGIYRLRYRPHTAATSWINAYNELAAERRLVKKLGT
jgi:hypothetical protein